MRAAIYCRVSTQAQGEDGTSLFTQEEACHLYATEHGYQIDETHIYRETYSGAELWERPQLTALRDAMRQRALQAVIVYAIDRLSRDPVHLGVLLCEAEHYGVAVQFVTEPLDDTPEGQLIRFVRGYAARVEREKVRERTIRGKRARLQGGKLHSHGVELYGYRRDKERGIRLVYEPEVPVVRQVFQWVAQDGLSTRAVARRLNNSGVPAPSVGKLSLGRQTFWAKGQVHRLLQNPAYKGRSVAWRWKYGGNHRNPTIRPENEWIILPDGTTPEIVSAELWEAAQNRLASNKGQDTRNQARPYLLRGRVFCALCGRRMRASPEHGRRTYRCSSRETASGPCGASRVPAQELEDWTWGQVAAVLRDPRIIAAELERRRQASDGHQLANECHSLQRYLDKICHRQERLVRQYSEAIDDAFPWELVKREISQAEEEKKQLLIQLATLERCIAAQEQATLQLEGLTAYCHRVSEKLEVFGFEEKRLALEALAIKIMANGWQWELQGSIPAGNLSPPSAGYGQCTRLPFGFRQPALYPDKMP